MSHGSNKKKFNIFDYFRDLEKFYGVIYMLLLVFIVFLGARYVKTIDYNKLFYAKELLSSDSNMRVSLPVKKGSISPPVDVIKLSTPSQEIADKGKNLYNTYCSSCHGETGAGNGPAGGALNPPPRNFVDLSAQQWKIGQKISNMYVTLQEGIPNTGMASFSTISPEDRFAIIQYVRTFNPAYPKDSPEDLKALDEKYSLSNGVKEPNQIPISLAMDLNILKADTIKANIAKIVADIDASTKDTIAFLLNELISDKKKALTSLASNTKWTESPEEFIKFAGTDPIDKGLKASVYQIKPDTMNRIYVYLKDLFAKYKA
ncbi:MAG: hypothetical protein HGGPFJEG_00017 [Ignavibacteria bacterium]|nr:hypothetical protein [Ignavibacteria bacterium]